MGKEKMMKENIKLKIYDFRIIKIIIPGVCIGYEMRDSQHGP